MTIVLSEMDWYELYEIAQLQGEAIYHATSTGSWLNLPQQLGVGGEQTILLRNGLILDIRDCLLREDLRLIRQHGSSFPLTSKFFLSSCSRVCTANIPTVKSDYQEKAGYNYLYYLPDLVEVEEWPAQVPIRVVMIYADLNYFRQFKPDHSDHRLFPELLYQWIERDSIQPFHQLLGKTTPAMVQVLQQILACPYQGLIQQLYLEGKALELLALQFAQWTEFSPKPDCPIRLRSNDIDRLHQAQAILIQQISHPPSLLELARQVGLNDRKLKQGFLQLFGKTVFGYLHDCRMEQSRQLLESGDMSVTEIAHRVGYSSLPSFSKAFRKKYGESPIAYLTGRSTQKVRLG
ncbi:hypothetical protein BST81_18645 [Leptolyngbya sp. 'hensonii']|uniref:helix-turn-helix transcriptional regulator n=1 Tax=Leptolyngbya sp. 'hensonii' TaxID=1922337 RepID=UPI00094F9E32|nr:AraC family transcriptional regulator [Leptolyngbya sp. 'hensonii']OLP16997.1 hypothetical protein BST81_18645 [Leptolyngbya sp. 'hensonii']